MKFTKAKIGKKTIENPTAKDFKMVQITLTFPVLADSLDEETICTYLQCATDEVGTKTDTWVAVYTSDVTEADLKKFAKDNDDWYIYNPDGDSDFKLSDIVK
jgi:hypothetical protein